MTTHDQDRELTRREALRLMGVGVGVGALAGTGLLTARAVAAQQSPVVRTLLGDLPPARLGEGAVLMHEHLHMRYPPGSASSFSDDVDLMIREVREARADGVAAIVDAGHADMERSIANLQRIAEGTGVPVVASGGYYMQRTYPEDLAGKGADRLAEELVDTARRERHGAFGEIGQQGGVLTADERKVFEAIGKAQAMSGLPVYTHNAYSVRATDVPRDGGLVQLDILERAGADPAHVCIGHVCCLDDPNVEIAKEVARRGAYVGFDRVTINGTMPDEQRVRMAMAFIEAGHADKLLLASDFYSRRSLKSEGGGGIGQTVTVFGPMLRAAGLSQADLDRILSDNPRRFLAVSPKI